MNHCIKPASVLLFLTVLSVPAVMDTRAASQDEVNKTGIFLNEIGIGSGYINGSLEPFPDKYSVYPAFVRFGFNISSLIGMESRLSTLQLALEPFVNSFEGENQGIETGCSIGVRYFHKIAGSVDLFTEAGVAPMFLGIDTVEQGKSGFNFLDQIGAGLQYKLSGSTAFFIGYRFRHISNASIVNRPNSGLNSDALIGGFSWLY
ncbi:MAG: acyloxyacyl hydrolase [Geobacteraceae bacterium]|nr:acyloxyacyl hydrolase [Geobacteraceae bacterium]